MNNNHENLGEAHAPLLVLLIDVHGDRFFVPPFDKTCLCHWWGPKAFFRV